MAHVPFLMMELIAGSSQSMMRAEIRGHQSSNGLRRFTSVVDQTLMSDASPISPQKLFVIGVKRTLTAKQTAQNRLARTFFLAGPSPSIAGAGCAFLSVGAGVGLITSTTSANATPTDVEVLYIYCLPCSAGRNQ
jgi:hypothetical protein